MSEDRKPTSITQIVYGRGRRPEGKPERPPNHSMTRIEDLLDPNIVKEIRVRFDNVTAD